MKFMKAKLGGDDCRYEPCAKTLVTFIILGTWFGKGSFKAYCNHRIWEVPHT